MAKKLMPELRRCPYCGGIAQAVSKIAGNWIMGGKRSERYIRCEKCHARTQAFGKFDNCINTWQVGAIFPPRHQG